MSEVDWHDLWKTADGPQVAVEDLELLGNVFTLVDIGADGVLGPDELPVLQGALAAAVATELFEPLELDLPGCVPTGGKGMDAAWWVDFHIAALTNFGLREWRRALEAVAAVVRVTRTTVPVEEPWIVSVSIAGKIATTWFSRKELLPEERAAIRALLDAQKRRATENSSSTSLAKGQSPWRCLSCEAEDLAARSSLPLLTRAATDGQKAREVAPRRSGSGEIVSERVTPPDVIKDLATAARHAACVAKLALRRKRRNTICHTTVAPMASEIKKVEFESSVLPSNSDAINDNSGNSLGKSHCHTLSEMLSHRAMRPLRKAVELEDRVVIENARRGTARDKDLGASGVVTRLFCPEKAIVPEMWCQLELVKETQLTGAVEVMLPVRSVASLKVPLHPDDVVESYQPTRARLRKPDDRTQDTHRGKVLGLGKQNHLVEIRFDDGETFQVPMGWVMCVEMSAWTQVLRQAPHSTLLFLLCDLQLWPRTAADRKEVEDRLRRDFQPHGRFRFIGTGDSQAKGEMAANATCAIAQPLARFATPKVADRSRPFQLDPDASPGVGAVAVLDDETQHVIVGKVPLSDDWNAVFERKVNIALEQASREQLTVHDRNEFDLGLTWKDHSKPVLLRVPEIEGFPLQIKAATPNTVRRRAEWLAIGDRGRVLSFDLEALEVWVVPDRKKHLKLVVALSAIEPDASELEVAVKCGSSAMHLFKEDPPILSAAKKNDITLLRQLLDNVAKGSMFRILFDDNRDADGQTVLHAAIYGQSVAMWKLLWSRLTLDQGVLSRSSTADMMHRALLSKNDWGRTPLWVAIESQNEELCKLLLDAGMAIEQIRSEAPVLPECVEAAKTDGFADYFGGPGLVAPGTEYEVTFFSPSYKLHFNRGTADGSAFVVSSSFGEAVEASVTAGDELLSVNGKSVSKIKNLSCLEGIFSRAQRPLVLGFRKGKGLLIRPLHRACELGQPKIVQLLLSKIWDEADFNWRDLCGRSAMDRSVRYRNRRDNLCDREPFDECILALENAGASESGQVFVLDADGQKHRFEAPAHWGAPDRRVVEGRHWIHIEETSAELLSHFQQVVDRSVGVAAMKGKKTKDRRDGNPPTKLVVHRVQRIENVACLCDYLQRRHLVRRAVSAGMGSRFVEVDCSVKVNYSVLVRDQGGSEATSPLDSKGLNEVYLFHGTSPAAAEGIAHEDFLLSLAGSKNGDAFGRGIYFAENALKCDEYTEAAPVNHKFAGLRPLLLCRVLLGRICVSEDADCSWAVSEIMAGKSESLLADRKAAVNTFREFIIFDEDQTYAEYILWYDRHYG